MNNLKEILFERCHEAALKQMNFVQSRANPNEPQTEEEARQYFRALYQTVLAAGLAEESNEWKESGKYVGEKIP